MGIKSSIDNKVFLLGVLVLDFYQCGSFGSRKS